MHCMECGDDRAVLQRLRGHPDKRYLCKECHRIRGDLDLSQYD